MSEEDAREAARNEVEFLLRSSDHAKLIDSEQNTRGYIFVSNTPPRYVSLHVVAVTQGESFFDNFGDGDMYIRNQILIPISDIRAVPYQCGGDTRKGFVESIEMEKSSEGYFKYFCIITDASIEIHTPHTSGGSHIDLELNNVSIVPDGLLDTYNVDMQHKIKTLWDKYELQN